MDYCEKCWCSIRQNTQEAKIKMSNSLIELHKNNPKIRKKISKTLIKNKTNVGDSNGMKKLENRLKVSNTRKKLFKNPSFREKASNIMIKAWADGKFENVNVGKCKWYTYKHSNGKNTKFKELGNWNLLNG